MSVESDNGAELHGVSSRQARLQHLYSEGTFKKNTIKNQWNTHEPHARLAAKWNHQ